MTIREVTYTICAECRQCNDTDAVRCRRCGTCIAAPETAATRGDGVMRPLRFIVFGLAWSVLSLIVGMLTWRIAGRASLPAFAAAGGAGVLLALFGALWLVRRISLGRDRLVATLMIQSFVAALLIGGTGLGVLQVARHVPSQQSQGAGGESAGLEARSR